eukprot:423620-Pleurochrysis_carterae.AAC.1
MPSKHRRVTGIGESINTEEGCSRLCQEHTPYRAAGDGRRGRLGDLTADPEAGAQPISQKGGSSKSAIAQTGPQPEEWV